MRHKCKHCGKPGESKGLTSQGIKRYRNECSICRKQKKRSGFTYGIFKKNYCELCGFKPIHMCQLDVDHKDGDRKNNLESNLQTLCANCHRLKTFLSGDNVDQISLELK